MNEDYSLLDFEFSNGRKKLKVTLTYFNNVPKIDIREYYLDKIDGIFKPSKKGIQLDASKADLLRTALEQNSKIIDKHLISESLLKWASEIKEIKTKTENFSNYEFFKSVSRGSYEEVIFNENHPFSKRLIEIENKKNKDPLSNELLSIIKLLLLFYNNSLSQFDNEAKIKVEDFVYDQSIVWSTLLKRAFN